MHHRIGRALLAAAIIFSVAGNALAQKTIEEIVVRVNGDIILKSELENAKNSLRAEISQQQKLQGAQLEQAIAEQSKVLLRDLIDQTLLMQQAKEMGLNADLEVVKTMEQMRQQYKFESLEELEKAISQQGNLDDFKQNIRNRYLSSQVLGREVYPKVIITTDEMRKYYDTNLKNFDRPEGVRVSEITFYTENMTPEEVAAQRKKAEEALAAVKKGDPFDAVATKFSEAPTAQSGGDLGFFVKGELQKPLEDAAAQLEKGQTSDILQLAYGFVILKVEDKHNGGVLPFELAQNEIKDALFQQYVQPKIREYLTRLRSESFVDIKPGYVDVGAAPPSKGSEANSGKN